MSKYSALFERIAKSENDREKLSFSEIEKLGGVPLDHSFLNAKKELEQLGWRVKKISLKEKTVVFEKLDKEPTGQRKNESRN